MKKSEMKSYIYIFILGFGIGLIVRPITNIVSYLNKTNEILIDYAYEVPNDNKLYDEFNMKKHTGSKVRDTISLHNNLCILVTNKESSYSKYAAVNNLSLWPEDELQKDDYSYYISERLFYEKLRISDIHLYYIASDFILGTQCNSDLTVIGSDFYVSSSSIYVSYLIKSEAGEVIGIIFFEI